jgi:hypothetical protein
MTQAEQQYFAIMRAALWDTPVALEGTPEWEGIMRIASHHATNVLVADVASRLEGELAPSSNLLREMRVSMRSNLMQHLELKRILTMAVNALREKDIEPILLKGFGLALLYPNPHLRQFGDIDLYIGQKQFHKACYVLRALPGSYNWGDEVDTGRHYNIEFGQHPMEIHRVSVDIDDPKAAALYETIEQDGLADHRQTVDFEGFPLSVPSKEFVVFFTFFHVWEHFMTTGVGWRQLSDVAMTLHRYHNDLDTSKLRSWIMAMHMMESWQAFGWLMVNRLGLPEEEFPFYEPNCQKRALKLYDRVMAEGNFCRPNRFKHSKPKGRFAKKIHSFIGIFIDYHHLSAVFPSQAKHEMIITLKTGFAKNFQKK